MNRYRLYDRLMTFGFILAALGIAEQIAAQLGGMPNDFGQWTWLTTSINIVALLLLPFLVVARFMRDEFAEMLWQRAAATTMLALVVLPIPILIVVFALADHGTASVVANAASEVARVPVNKAGFARMVGIGEAVMTIWVVVPEVFLIAYQWHRWRT